jgi:HEAT repeat protein
VESLSLMLLASAGSATIASLVVVATVVVRILRAMRTARLETRRARLEPLLFRTLDTGRTPRCLRRLKRRDTALLSQLVVELLGMLRGAQREHIVRLAADAGLVELDVRALASGNHLRRARAAENLGHYGGPEHAVVLGQLLDDPEEIVRAVVARSLSRIGTGEAAHALALKLTSPSEVTGLRMAENLERMGTGAVRSLVTLLDSVQHDDRRGQVLAARVLGNLRVADARPALRSAIQRRWNTDLRAQATLALGRIGHPDDVPPLLMAATDSAWPVRVQAANALGMIGDVSTVPLLRQLLHDPEWWVRESAGAALANLGDAGLQALADVVQAAGEQTRLHAASALEGRAVAERLGGAA